MINYFNYKKFQNKYLLTNDLGNYLFATKDELKSLIEDNVDISSDFGTQAKNKLFYYDGSMQAFSENLKYYLRESKNYLFSATSLHIFVVTNSCNMQCVYCQAQNGKEIPNGMMTKEVAKKAVNIALSSPAENLSFEFQGGEPLLNFEIIKYIVEYTNSINTDKQIQFNIVSNLTIINDEIIEFIKKYNVGISTSIDGNKELHNLNRKYRTNFGTYDDVLKGIKLLEKNNIPFGAIQTTTKNSLKYSKQIVDTYINLGLANLFIRPLTPLGCADNNWNEIGYSPEEFIDFYKECFNLILDANKKGIYIKEGHASLMLSKILTGHAINYMELRSPCGAGIGQLAYYYDGNIYTCDEGRMLAEMGNDSFKLGTVDDNYNYIIGCDRCKAACLSSILESLPNCNDCVYNPYCGTCPVVNLSLQGDIINKEPRDYKCKIYSGIFDTIFSALQDNDNLEILKTWL